MWSLVGSTRDVVMADYLPNLKNLVIEANLRVLSVPLDEANVPLPEYPKANIDF